MEQICTEDAFLRLKAIGEVYEVIQDLVRVVEKQ
jgi:hypothetical protein